MLRPEKRRAFVALLTVSSTATWPRSFTPCAPSASRSSPEQIDHFKDEFCLPVTEYRDLSIRQFDLGNLPRDGAELLRSSGPRLPSSLMRMLVVLVMVSISVGPSIPASGSPSGSSRTCGCNPVRSALGRTGNCCRPGNSRGCGGHDCPARRDRGGHAPVQPRPDRDRPRHR